jgi:hypothetical protein
MGMARMNTGVSAVSRLLDDETDRSSLQVHDTEAPLGSPSAGRHAPALVEVIPSHLLASSVHRLGPERPRTAERGIGFVVKCKTNLYMGAGAGPLRAIRVGKLSRGAKAC